MSESKKIWAKSGRQVMSVGSLVFDVLIGDGDKVKALADSELKKLAEKEEVARLAAEGEAPIEGYVVIDGRRLPVRIRK
jgi:hypothetical protein